MFLALKSILLRCGEFILLINQLKLLVAVRLAIYGEYTGDILYQEGIRATTYA
jgi:hypothetical protein